MIGNPAISRMPSGELRYPLLVAALAFGFWMFSDLELAQYVLCGALAILALKHPLNGVLFLVANETYIGSTPAVIGGVSLTQIVGGLLLFVCLSTRRPLPPLFNWISFLVVTITLLYSYSYFSYFQTFDLSIFNNMVFYFLVLWSVDFRNGSNLRQIALTLLITNLLLIGISLGYFVNNTDDLTGGPFGNARQVGFFGILTIPYLYVLLTYFRKSKQWHKVIYASLFLMVLYNIVTGGRLNIAILFVFLLLFCSKIFTQPLLPKKILLGSVIVCVAMLFSQGVVEKYLSRGLVETKSVGDILSLDEAKMDIFTSGRSAIYRFGWEMHKNYPLLGGGYKRWSHISNQYNPFVSAGGQERISMHSTHLQYLVETGLIGLLLYWLLLGLIGYISWRVLALKKLTPEDPLYLCGCIGLFVSLSMFLGGVFDNHGILYRQLFLAAAAAAVVSRSFRPRLHRSAMSVVSP